MQPQIVLREIASPAADLVHLRATACRHTDAGAEGAAIRTRPHELQQDPVARGFPRPLQQDRWFILIIDERFDSAVIVVVSARGAAFGDYDNDGAVEALINNQNEPPILLKRSGKPPGNWILLKLVGTSSNRSALGARVRVTAGGRTQMDEVRSGGSYLSQNDLRLHFGLGRAAKVESVE